jgi:opacity protein-like surface antigen
MKVWAMAALLALAGAGSAAAADHYVRGYTKSDGTYVQPHYQTNPNATRADNYSTQGNVNPYTGQPGTKPLYPPPPPPKAPVSPFTQHKACTFGQPC